MIRFAKNKRRMACRGKRTGEYGALKRILIALMLLFLPVTAAIGEDMPENQGAEKSVWSLLGFGDVLKTVQYTLYSEKIAQAVRIAHVSDLHACAYGEDQRELLEAIENQMPDLVLMTGDMFDGAQPLDQTVVFLRGLQGKYPCYYVTGNNEYERGKAGLTEIMAILKDCGVVCLRGEMTEIEINGTPLNICGVDDPSAWKGGKNAFGSADPSHEEQAARVAALAQNGRYTILLAHRPEKFDDYCQMGFDLVLSGHAHGGQWRIPGLQNGLYAPGQGLFPKYTGGKYEQNGAVMIVSRGLAKETTAIPRFNNNPELVIIDLLPVP